MDVSEVPHIRDNAAFVICERARNAAIEEVQTAGTDVERFEAVLVANHLRQHQTQMLLEIVNKIAEEGSRFDPDYGPFRTWAGAWMDQDMEPWLKYQGELLESLGRPEAQRIADERATPRVQAVLEEVRTALRRELDDSGGAPVMPMPPGGDEPAETEGDAQAEEGSGLMKTCPDCAERVRAAARKCRYCGYRFDDQEQPG